MTKINYTEYDTLSYLELSEPANVWAEKVASVTNSHNPSFNQKVRQAGYDINDVCNSLLDIYKKIIIDEEHDQIKY